MNVQKLFGSVQEAAGGGFPLRFWDDSGQVEADIGELLKGEDRAGVVARLLKTGQVMDGATLDVARFGKRRLQDSMRRIAKARDLDFHRLAQKGLEMQAVTVKAKEGDKAALATLEGVNLTVTLADIDSMSRAYSEAFLCFLEGWQMDCDDAPECTEAAALAVINNEETDNRFLLLNVMAYAFHQAIQHEKRQKKHLSTTSGGSGTRRSGRKSKKGSKRKSTKGKARNKPT